MKSSFCNRSFIIFQILLLICFNGIANEKLYTEARTLQHEGKYDEAIVGFKNCLLLPIDGDVITSQQMTFYTNALVQLMNTFQSKGDPEACISTLQDIFEASPAIQKYCLRDYYSVLGYALSRTENMKDAEETMLKALTSKDKYRSDDNFNGWLRTIMHNTYLNMLRSRIIYLDEREIAITYAGRSSYFDTAFDYKELRRFVATLPREQHLPFTLHVKGYKYEEISLLLDLPPGTVKSRIFTARERLKTMLGES